MDRDLDLPDRGVVRVARGLLLLLGAALTIWFVAAVEDPSSGALEKVILVAAIGVCLVLAASGSAVAAKFRGRG